MMRLTFDPGFDVNPTWTALGERVVFASTRDGEAYNLFWKLADGTGQAERLTSSPNPQNPESISPDDKTLFFSETEPNTQLDLLLIPLGGERVSEVLLQTEFNEYMPEISPDGRWLAYISSESGQSEVYVSPFPDIGSGTWQVSSDGGMVPRWAPDQSELFYWGARRELMAVPVRTDGTFAAGSPEALFDLAPYYYGFFDYDTVDGQRFLLAKRTATSDDTPVRINIILNWFEELKDRVPVP